MLYLLISRNAIKLKILTQKDKVRKLSLQNTILSCAISNNFEHALLIEMLSFLECLILQAIKARERIFQERFAVEHGLV